MLEKIVLFKNVNNFYNYIFNMMYIFFILGFFGLIDILPTVNYQNFVGDVKFDNYEDLINKFEKNKDNSAKYWYFYGVLLKKITMLNLISDKLEYYVYKTREAFINSSKFDDRKYSSLSVNEMISMYNLFISRGNEYMEIGRLNDSLLSYTIARDFYNSIDVNVQIAFVYQLLNNTTEAINLYLKCISMKPVNELLVRINLNLIDIYLNTNEIDKAVQLLKNILTTDPKNIFYLTILEKMKNVNSIKIDDLISSDPKIRKFQRGVIFFREGKYKESYELLKDLKLNDVNHKKLFSDVLYNYCLILQLIKTTTDEFNRLVRKNISLCNDILYSEKDNEEIFKRIIDLYLSIGEIDEAEKFIQKRKIDLKKLYRR